MSENLLILHPADPDVAISTIKVLETLRKAGLAADDFEWEGERHYRPGERYLQLITFLGCSPVVSLGEPGLTGDEFAHLAIATVDESPVLVAGSNIKQPCCPQCRKQVESRSVRENAAAAEPWRCRACGYETVSGRLDWRQSAGYARTFVKIWGVFEGEAIPSDELLFCLKETAGTPWKYFYLRR